jgi:hypothetical protein
MIRSLPDVAFLWARRSIQYESTEFCHRWPQLEFLDLHEKDSHSCSFPHCQRAVDATSASGPTVTSIYVAINVNAESCIKAYLHGWPITRAVFCWRHFWDGAQHMLSKLSWKVIPNTPSSLVMYLLRLVPPRSAIPNQSTACVVAWAWRRSRRRLSLVYDYLLIV